MGQLTLISLRVTDCFYEFWQEHSFPSLQDLGDNSTATSYIGAQLEDGVLTGKQFSTCTGFWVSIDYY